MCASLFFTRTQPLVKASLGSVAETLVEGVHAFEEGRAMALGVQGGLGLRPGGWLQLAGERSSVSLVV